MKDKDIKSELRLYSERYYAEPLVKAGFANYRNDLLNWHKIYNGIICHFHILVGHSRFPMLKLVWWIHPTYVPATLSLPAAWTNFQEPVTIYANRAYFDSYVVEPNGGINIPNLPQRGAERLYEKLFPQLEQLQTREAVYHERRNFIVSCWENGSKDYPLSNLITAEFADEALMMKDTEMFPSCIETIERILPVSRYEHMQRLAETTLVWRSTEQLEAQLNALKGIEVERYMELLKERKAKFMKRYKLQDDFEL